mmetsp:Transcript_65313/g.189297  ORF Transcript_65313/g.189297 Transcript_65313/m.189297 type:complete len:363 (-) Transcript_65313:3-1091(-)
MIPTEHGMPCPPLEARLPCGASPCPKDCQVGPWEEWTSCTSACGGGTQSRSRAILTEARRGGEPCPSDQDRRTCNIGACDRDCQLSDWSDWGACSRACRFDASAPSGRRTQARAVSAMQVGRGECPEATDAARLRGERCNEQLCGARFDRCVGDRDILVLVDGSDSANFSAQLELVAGMAQHADKDMRFGVVAYGSKVVELSELTADRAALAAALKKATAPGGLPNLAAGEVAAKNLLVRAQFASSSDDVRRAKVVLVLSDGAPTHVEQAIEEAGEIRAEGLRLILGVVDGGSPEVRAQVCALAGAPCEANVEAVTSWAEMPRQPWRFLAALCERLEFARPEPDVGFDWSDSDDGSADADGS